MTTTDNNNNDDDDDDDYHDDNDDGVPCDDVIAKENSPTTTTTTTTTTITTTTRYLLSAPGKAAASCALYGADPPYTWEYGPARNQILQRTFTQGGATYLEFASPDGLHQFVVRQVSAGVCVPVVEYHPQSAVVFTSVQAGASAIPAGAFDLPAVCKKPVRGHGVVVVVEAI